MVEMTKIHFSNGFGLGARFLCGFVFFIYLLKKRNTNVVAAWRLVW